MLFYGTKKIGFGNSYHRLMWRQGEKKGLKFGVRKWVRKPREKTSTRPRQPGGKLFLGSDSGMRKKLGADLSNVTKDMEKKKKGNGGRLVHEFQIGRPSELYGLRE